MDKILALADLHSGHDRESLTHPGFFRQCNTDVVKEIKDLPKLLPKDINIYINLGDLIRESKDNEYNHQEYEKISLVLDKTFNKIEHLIGNHDRNLNNYSKIKNINSYSLKNSLIVFINSKEEQILSSKEISLLKLELSKSTNKPILIFTHIPIFPINSDDNYYFYQKENNQFFKNYQEIKNLLESKSKVYVISGHYHWLSSTEISPNIKQITLPSFSENIITSLKSNVHPCVYNLIKINKYNLLIKSYSRQFCFGTLEFNFK